MIKLKVFEKILENHTKYKDNVMVESSQCELTYENSLEFINKACEIYRQKCMFQKNSVIGVFLKNLDYLLPTIFSIWKVRCVYLPLDISFPKERIEYILKNSNCNYIITDDELFFRRNYNTDIKIINIEEIKNRNYEHYLELTDYSSEDIAYIIYTSGTTGIPKGCPVKHKNINALFESCEKEFKFNNQDKWILMHSPCFDFSIWEIVGSILFGSSIFIPSKFEIENPSRILNILETKNITVFNQTPSAFYRYISEVESLKKDFKNLNLRYLIFGGEKLNFQTIINSKDKFSKDIRIINMYGITESTIHSSFYQLDLEKNINNSIIGLPLKHLNFFILDDKLNTVEDNYGELYISGDSIIEGYLNEELNKDKFLISRDNTLMYKTGDIVRKNNYGEYEYINRIDNQVQIRGYRIEIDEIVKNIMRIDSIIQCEIFPNERNTYLIAVILSSIELRSKDIKSYLKNFLPAYMIPNKILILDNLPITNSGKIDKKKIVSSVESEQSIFIEVMNYEEHIIQEIWSSMFDTENVNRNTDFFEIGGNSIDVVYFINELRKKSLSLEIKDVFELKTLYLIAKKIVRKNLQINESDNKNIKANPTYFQKKYLLNGVFSDQNSDDWFLKKIILTNQYSIEKLNSNLNILLKRHKILKSTLVKNNLEFIHEDKEILVVNSLKELECEVKQITKKQTNLFECVYLSNIYGSSLNLIMHHLIVDKISIDIIVSDLTKIMAEETLSTLNKSFKDYSLSEARILQELTKEDDKYIFWIEEIRKAKENIQDSWILDDCNSIFINISDDNFNIINLYSQENSYTKNTIWIALSMIIISKLLKKDSITIGQTMSIRHLGDYTNVVGPFINHTLFTINGINNLTFYKICDVIQNKSLEYYKYIDVPIEYFRTNKFESFFDYMVNIYDYKYNYKIVRQTSKKNKMKRTITVNIHNYFDKSYIEIRYKTHIKIQVNEQLINFIIKKYLKK